MKILVMQFPPFSRHFTSLLLFPILILILSSLFCFGLPRGRVKHSSVLIFVFSPLLHVHQIIRSSI
jgi:hypothetical protein